ncbi:MAG: hypothetical protein ACU0CC_18370 [Sagittula sp.]|jgi:hypothetical protein|uniref:hypothetical protein n=1 Tax=unclassified Sagittula TaxID=2624628 RepID=UPI000C2D5538|nr:MULTISPECIES: hypothetical protein [unclassified Sagittula]AUC51866.1 hypothetical protein CDO87_01055 [Sagittula sp. P11]WHZ36954.1 hypothetical protein QNI11_08025 [Sagittula sp. MA-2]
MADEIEILGLGPHGLHLSLGPVTALAPKSLLEREMGTVTEDRAMEWAAAQKTELEGAMTALINGATPPAPFDEMTLETES